MKKSTCEPLLFDRGGQRDSREAFLYLWAFLNQSELLALDYSGLAGEHIVYG